MADQKITQLTALASAASTDVLPIVDVANTETKKITKADLLNGLQAELVSGTNIKTINSTSLLGSGDIAISANPAGTDGQIQFNSSSAFGADSNLFWDNTNKRLGVGTSTPSSKITAQTTSAADGIVLQDASNQLALIGKWFDSSGFFDLNQSGTPYTRIQASQSYINTPLTIGTATAISARLAVKGSGSTSATTSLLVQNSSGTAAFQIKDDMQVSLPSTATNNTLAIGGQVGPSKNGVGVGYTSAGNVFVRGGLFMNPNTDVCDLYGSGNSVMSWIGNTVLFKAGNNGASFSQASALVSIDSTTQGFLPPRMTTTQKNAISSPASGLIVYDTTTNKLCCYNGTSWNDLF